jgi:glutaminase
MSSFTSSINSIRELIIEIFERHRHLYDGTIADYIPELTRASPDWFGIAITTVDGRQYLVGDTAIEFTIQSVSKPFIYGMAIDAIGLEAVREKIDVEPSGEAFNSISLKATSGQPRNPMINAGAIAATGMISARDVDERFQIILDRFGEFAGRPLKLDESVYRSESDTGWRNRGIANLLRNFNIIEGEVDPILEAYFMQCAILVDSQALSVMGATLANGGINPLTGKRVLSQSSVEKVSSVMSTCGMYDYSGNWAYEVGIPAKSGVGGGIIGVLPGQLSVAVFSPLLDENYNSVRGIATFRDLSKSFGLHLFNRPSLTNYVIRRTYTLAEFQSSRFRPREAHDVLQREGHRVRIYELQGDLYFGAVERLINAYLRTLDDNDRVVIDLTRIGSIDEATRAIIFRFARQAFEKGKRIVLVDPGQIFSLEERRSLVPMVFVYDDCDEAMEDAEENLLAQFGARSAVTRRLGLERMDLLQDIDAAALKDLNDRAELRTYAEGERIIEQGTPPDDVHFLSMGIVGIFLQKEEVGTLKQVSSFTPGMSFGELSFIQGTVRTADVVAVTDVETFSFTREALESFRKIHPEGFQTILKNAIVALSDRLVRANREVAALK